MVKPFVIDLAGGKGVAMSDPVDLVAGSALPAMFTFFFQRLDSLLTRHRSGRASEPEPLPEVPPELVGTLHLPLVADPVRLRGRIEVLEALALALTHYQRSPASVTGSDQVLLQTLGRARAALEDIYGQRFTFDGEERQASGPLSEHRYTRVAGEVVAMEAQERITGDVEARVTAETVERGGRVVGMRAPIIEGRP
ncbi:hypothetical protein [Kitasatospora sp. SUK 42]|uniref:hypothetical protein n=1 Tax=Kitasatospora sp. SUK 42 TaxID=1588882 RepID=UPI0018CA68E4|nr:hypothetical protein [Kitasatospora sp. SUK 42]MBV2151273.1 hypothetical protein [Kitasatospora sp. SUK 42]